MPRYPWNFTTKERSIQKNAGMWRNKHWKDLEDLATCFFNTYWYFFGGVNRSRTKNLVWYGVLGSKEMVHQTYKNLDQRVQLECDGQRIPLPNLQGIVILNISSYMGGINFWGSSKENDVSWPVWFLQGKIVLWHAASQLPFRFLIILRVSLGFWPALVTCYTEVWSYAYHIVFQCFAAPSMDDKILEVVAVFGSAQLGISRVINLQHHRIAQVGILSAVWESLGQ